MKKILLIWGLLIGLFVNAQVVQITTGVAGTPAYNAGPIYRSSNSSAYDASRYSYLYTASELAAAGISPGSIINDLGWMKNNNATTTGGGIFRIYMKNSTAATYGNATETWANLNAGTTLVYQNLNQAVPATQAPNYIVFPLTTGFTYTGGSLEISVEWDINQVSGNPSTGTFDWMWSTVPDRIYGTGNTTIAGMSPLSSTSNSISDITDRRPFLQIGYSPGTACSGAVTAGTASASVTNACANVPFNLLLTGATNGAGMTYQWQSSPVGAGTFTNIVGATTISYAVANQTAPRDYRCVVTCTNGGSTQNSNIVSVAQNTPAQCIVYCTPTGGASSTTYYLNNITTNAAWTNINYTANTYTAYVNSNMTATTSPGNNVNISLASSGGSTYYYRVWVDWNNDGVFTNAAPELVLSNASYAATLAGTIPVPATTALGNYRVRTSSSFSGVVTPCGPAPYGNYVDFTLSVVTPPSCMPPTAVTLVNTAATNANISWTAPTPVPANGYDVYYNTTGIAPTGATILNATNSVQSATTTANIPGLTPITTYYVWVRAICSATDKSFWSQMPAFMTSCVAVTALPWTENFDAMTALGAGILPPCWMNVTGTKPWTSSNAIASTTSPGPRSTPNYVRIQYGNTNASQLWTPGFALTAGVTYEFSFYYHTGGTGSGLVGYTGNVLVNTAQSTTGATNLGTYITATQGTSAYTQYKVYYTPTASGSYNFGVNTSSNSTPWYLGVDDFKLRVAPTCLDVQGLTIANTTTTSTTVQWTISNPAPANGYDVYYTTNPATPLATVTPQFAGVAGPSQFISGLAPSTTYYIWVRARCSSTDIGDWTGPLSVYTNYCAPTGGTSSTTYYLKNITTTLGFTNIAYTATSYSAYVNNSAQSFSVLPGGSVTVNLGATSGTHYFHAWVDWNQNMVFEATEAVYTPTGYLASVGFPISSVGRPSGSYRIRFANNWLGAVPPCGPAAYGNYVDYTFIIRPCSTIAPTNVNITAITHVSATVNWTPSTDNLGYRVYWREVGTTGWPNSSPILTPPTVSYPIATGLLPAKNYEAMVVAVCNTTEGTATPVPFTTKCDPTPPNITITNITSTTALVTWNPLVAGASYELQWKEVGSTLPPSTPIGGTPQPPLNSYLITGLSSYKTYEVQVRNKCIASTTPNPWSNPQVFTTVRVCEVPPPGLTITTLSPTSAEVVWDAYTGSDATGSYILKYRKVGIPSWTSVTVNNNTYTITGLLELTKYEMQVANVCSGTPGNFTPPYYFTTPTVVYCQMSSSSSAAEFINKVTVKPTGKPEIINETVASNYSDFTAPAFASKYIEMIQGSTGNQITVDKTLSSGATAGVAVWIDFNRNGTFDLNERILADGPNTNPTASATFAVPADAFISMTDYKYVRMRVAMQKDGIPVNCLSFPNGEVEDYLVRISKPGVANALNQTDIMIYPNPVSTVLNVKNISKKANYKIYSAAGQLVSNGLILNNKIDVSKLINGVYVIDIDDVNGTAQKKFIKE